MVTVRGPVAAVGEMLMLAVAWVASVTVSVLTVMSELPKLATVVPCAKWVAVPVMATFRFACACCAELELTEPMAAGPACTVKPFVSLTVSLPDVRVTSRVPVAVVGEMLMLAVAWVASVTVSMLTVMPTPKLAVVACAK